jgi:chemotaxis protein histidine kinase CheA
VLGDYQTVIKNLGRFYKDVQLISGATILGNGTVALIIDPHRLVREALRNMTGEGRAHNRVSAQERSQGVAV